MLLIKNQRIFHNILPLKANQLLVVLTAYLFLINNAFVLFNPISFFIHSNTVME